MSSRTQYLVTAAFGLCLWRSAQAEPPAPAPVGTVAKTKTSTRAERTFGFTEEELELLLALDDPSDFELLKSFDLVRMLPFLEGDDDE